MTDKPERILIEDDEGTICEITANILSSVGYDCKIVGTPASVFDALKSGQTFDLVCCGITEWAEDDFERMVKSCPKVPVVVSSGTLDAQLILRAYEAGVYDFLLRPFEREQLIFAIRRALDYRRLKLESLYLRNRLGLGSGVEIPRSLLKSN